MGFVVVEKKTMAALTGFGVSFPCDDLERNYLCSWYFLLEEPGKSSKAGKGRDRVGESEMESGVEGVRRRH